MTMFLGLLANTQIMSAQILGTLLTAQPLPAPFPQAIADEDSAGFPRLAYAQDVMSGDGEGSAVTLPIEPETAENPTTTETVSAPEPVVTQEPALTQAPEPVIANPPAQTSELAAQIEALRLEMVSQRALLEAQAKIIAAQQDQLRQLAMASANAQTSIARDDTLSEARGAGYGSSLIGGIALAAQTPADGGSSPVQPVGVAPPPAPTVQSLVEAVPEGQGVLTPVGRFVLDTSFEYTNSSNNRLVFRGFELIPGLQVGLIEASDVDRDTIVGTIAGRYGLTRRLEIEARMPVMYRSDRIEVTQQRDEGIVRTLKLSEYNIGDAEFSMRYQLNAPKVPNKAIWIASLRVKSDTGKSPFDVIYDEFGVATGLATGSGFWAAQPGLNFLLPSDPVVIYGGASYLYHIPRNIDQQIGNALIGRVDPGDAINANIGFGFALNQKFSFSLGYRHSYLFPTKTEIGTTLQRSNHLQVGSLGFGMSYRLSARQSINFGVELGATADAPNVSAVLRLPLSF